MIAPSRLLLCLLPALLAFQTTKICQADDTANGLTEAEKRGGWKLLFDGKSSAGWRNYRTD